EEEVAEYKYDYGFNPLLELGEYLLAHDPAVLEKRRLQRKADAAYIKRRGQHAVTRDENASALKELALSKSSGITSAPVVECISCTEAVLLADVLAGATTLHVKISTDHAFGAECTTASAELSQTAQGVGKIHLSNVAAGAVNYYQCWADTGEAQEGHLVREGSFRCLPGPEASRVLVRLCAEGSLASGSRAEDTEEEEVLVVMGSDRLAVLRDQTCQLRASEAGCLVFGPEGEGVLGSAVELGQHVTLLWVNGLGEESRGWLQEKLDGRESGWKVVLVLGDVEA
ncbi:unnamed protein product, partial [Chrysoparadoxa australica]